MVLTRFQKKQQELAAAAAGPGPTTPFDPEKNKTIVETNDDIVSRISNDEMFAVMGLLSLHDIRDSLSCIKTRARAQNRNDYTCNIL